MVKLKYSFKSFFEDDYNTKVRAYHNDEWVSNGHFAIKKSILTKTHLKVVNKHPQDIEMINKLINIAKNSKKIFNDKREDKKTQFIPDFIMKDFPKNIGITVYDSNLDVLLRQDYYNFITDRKCKIYMGAGRLNPLIVYNKNNEFVGIILPVRTNKKDITKEGENYQNYITELEKEQQEQKRIKTERKKLNKKTLYIKNNKAIIRKQPLKSLSDVTGIDKYNNIYIEAEPKDKYVELYLDLDIIHMNIGNTIRLDCLDDTNTKNLLDFLSTFTLEKYKEMIEGNLKENKWINTAEIKLMELAGESEEYIQKLWKHRDYVKELTDKERQEKEEQRRKEEQEYVESQNKIVDDLITQAEQSILNKETVFNEEITIYNDITNRYDSNTTSLILHLFKLYDIKVPLKTQGWINEVLYCLKYSNSNWSYQYYNSSNDSTVFYKYLDKLITAVEEKYTITA